MVGGGGGGDGGSKNSVHYFHSVPFFWIWRIGIFDVEGLGFKLFVLIILMLEGLLSNFCSNR